MASNMFINLSRKARGALVEYSRNWMDNYHNFNTIRDRMQDLDREYARTYMLNQEARRASLAQRYGDKYKLGNIVVPVVMPQVESALAFLSEVFLSGNPIFAMSSDPGKQDLALMYNTIIEDQQDRGGWVAEFVKFFRDGLKYNLQFIDVDWCQERIWKIETQPSIDPVEGQRTEQLWQGNKIRRIDPYNAFFDWRVPPHLVASQGEFVGYTEIMSHIQLRRLIASLPQNGFTDAHNEILASPIGGRYYVPEVNLEPLMNTRTKEFNWLDWVSNTPNSSRRKFDYRGAYEVTKLYVRIVPEDFEIRVPADKQVQIWKLYIVNNQHLLYAERQTNAHELFGIVVGQPINDGLSTQTKSFADNIGPFQEIATALWNAKLNSVRRRLTDRMLYNPSMIRESDINSSEPNAKIPVRNTSYAKSLSEAVYQIPFEDQGSQFYLQEADAIINMSYFASGQNRVTQGQFQKGNKTLREFETTMGNANARDRLMAVFIEAQTMQPIKTMLRYNILQYQPKGEIYSKENEAFVTIDPIELRKRAIDFKVSDGMTPVERLMSTDEFTVAMQTIQSVDELKQGYRVVPMFSYLMKLRGLKHLQTFEKSPMELAYEQQLASWQQVATEAVKKGMEPPPQPEMPPELVKFLQEQQAKFANTEPQTMSAAVPPQSQQTPPQTQG